MNRRESLGAFVAIVATAMRTGAAAAQSSTRIWRVGYLGPSAETAPHLVKAFQEGLAAYGYVEGRNLAVEYRWTNAGRNMTDEKTMLANAQDLASRKVDVIAASIDPAILAARKAAGGIPIVMMNASDPLELGLVDSLAHPGGTITGLTRLSPELVGKNLQGLLEVVPRARVVGLLVSTPNATRRASVVNARTAAEARAVALHVVEAKSAAELPTTFDALKQARADGLLLSDTGGGLFFTQRAQIAGLALAHRLPLISANTENVEAGGLMSYSPSSVDNYRRAAAFIDRILRGAKASELPVEQPATFELVINLRTARALQLVIPQTLLVRADRLIE
jgi:putative ABC transport system substrate-binding protein